MKLRDLLPALLACALASAVFATSPARAAERTEKLMMLEAGGTLEVAADGTVASVQVEQGVEAELAKALSNSLQRLHFEPVVVDGEVVRALTGFKVVLLGRKDEGKFSVTIDSINFHAPKGAKVEQRGDIEAEFTARTMNPPAYPRDEQRNGRMGMVKLAIRVGPDGRAAEVAAVDSFLYDLHVREGQGSVALRNFERASIEAAKRWTFNVPGNAAALDAGQLTVVTSVLYTLVDGKELQQPGQWWNVHKGPKRPIAWLPPAQSQVLADTALAAGSVSGGNGTFRLLAPVGGTRVF